MVRAFFTTHLDNDTWTAKPNLDIRTVTPLIGGVDCPSVSKMPHLTKKGQNDGKYA
jgi:hypothetical protein